MVSQSTIDAVRRIVEGDARTWEPTVFVTDGQAYRFGFAEQMAALDAKMAAAFVERGDDPVTPRQVAHDRAVRVLGPKRGRWK